MTNRKPLLSIKSFSTEDLNPYQPSSLSLLAQQQQQQLTITSSSSAPNSSVHLRHSTGVNTANTNNSNNLSTASGSASNKKRHRKTLSCISVKKLPNCRQS